MTMRSVVLFAASLLPYGADFATSTKAWLAPMHVITPLALLVALGTFKRRSP